ncbi:MAG: sigma-70 family RNA polymerase sigma factor [Actinomycetota bacterium]
MADEKNLTLREFLDSLPEEERVVLTLYFVKQITTREIATKLGVPERSIAAVLASGRARMSEAFNFPSGS